MQASDTNGQNGAAVPVAVPSRLSERMDAARGHFTPHLDVIAAHPVTEMVWRPGFGWVEREVAA